MLTSIWANIRKKAMFINHYRVFQYVRIISVLKEVFSNLKNHGGHKSLAEPFIHWMTSQVTSVEFLIHKLDDVNFDDAFINPLLLIHFLFFLPPDISY